MGRARVFLFSGAILLLSVPAASAADMPIPIKAPVVYEFSGWYLRGDIGMSSQRVDKMHQRLEDNVPERFNYSHSFDHAAFYGIGAGYQFNNWLRTDVTLEYRDKSKLTSQAVGNMGSVDNFTGKKSEITGLWNVYADLGTWWRFTPFVGAGLGFSYNRIHDFIDICGAGACNGQLTGISDGTGWKWNFAWALHAGVAYKVTPGINVELAYRYINLGDADSATFHNVDLAASRWPGPMQFKGITSHDVKLGVRWNLWEPEPPPPPLMRKG